MLPIDNGLYSSFLALLGINSNTYLTDIILSTFFTAFVIATCVGLLFCFFKILCFRK